VGCVIRSARGGDRVTQPCLVVDSVVMSIVQVNSNVDMVVKVM
jgi:hypothetical protein